MNIQRSKKLTLESIGSADGQQRSCWILKMSMQDKIAVVISLPIIAIKKGKCVNLVDTSNGLFGQDILI
jgi:hypothetical protein